MILTSITRALRAQNWTAVAIEFVIVILGVVVGFQISGWNDQRARQARTDAMTERLVSDMRDEQWRVLITASYLGDVITAGELALDGISGSTPLHDEALVINAFRASQYFWAGLMRSTYDELVATGDINLLRNPAMRAAAVEYYNSSQVTLMIELGDAPYRTRLRRRIDPGLHRALIEQCSEPQFIAIGDMNAIENVLDFPCSIDGFDSEIAAIAEALRGDPEFAELLRLRIIEADQERNSILYFDTLLRLGLGEEALN